MGVDHEQWMRLALEQAELGKAQGEVPVGAVVVADGELIAKGFNQPISSQDPSAHAEMVAIRNAAHFYQNYRLPKLSLYVTLEPCLMCTGLMLHARVETVVFGAFDPKVGSLSHKDLSQHPNLNHRIEVIGGVLESECASVLKEFFQNKREKDERNRSQ